MRKINSKFRAVKLCAVVNPICQWNFVFGNSGYLNATRTFELNLSVCMNEAGQITSLLSVFCIDGCDYRSRLLCFSFELVPMCVRHFHALCCKGQ